MCWLLSAEQTRINPFTRNPAKLPCRQALHLKCTISYPCLVWMQHFWNIRPGGNTHRKAAATPYIVPPRCFSPSCSLSSPPPHPLSLPFILIFASFFCFFLPILRWTVSRHLEEGERGWGASVVVPSWSLHSLQYVFWQQYKHALPEFPRSGLRE